MKKNNLLTQHTFDTTRAHRQERYGHRSLVVWMTGLSGSGKSTLANAVLKQLHEAAINAYILDGDNTRSGICSDLGFSLQDRTENIRRIAEIAKLFVDAGTVVITSLIAPIEHDRQMAREIVGSADMLEVFVACPLEVCAERDVKGLYQKAFAGEIDNFTGVGSPYEPPTHPDITVHTAENTIEDCVQTLFNQIVERIV
jgi:adenylylsulfate kinase